MLIESARHLERTNHDQNHEAGLAHPQATSPMYPVVDAVLPAHIAAQTSMIVDEIETDTVVPVEKTNTTSSSHDLPLWNPRNGLHVATEIETETVTVIASVIDAPAVALIAPIEIAAAAAAAVAVAAPVETSTSRKKTGLLAIRRATRIVPAVKTGLVVAKKSVSVIVIVIAILDDETGSGSVDTVIETVIVSAKETATVAVIVTVTVTANERRNALDEIVPHLP